MYPTISCLGGGLWSAWRAEFKGRRRQGDWADSLLELDPDFGSLLGLLDELGIASDTLVIFAGDNRPEDVLLWRARPALGRLLFRRRGGQPAHALHRALARPHRPGQITHTVPFARSPKQM